MAKLFFNNNQGALLYSDIVKIVRGDSELYNFPLGQFLGQVANLKNIQAPLTGTTINITDGVVNQILNPAGTIATLTVNMPPNPYDGQFVGIGSTQTVTALTMTATLPAGATIKNPLSTITAAFSSFGAWVYDAPSNTWFGVP